MNFSLSANMAGFCSDSHNYSYPGCALKLHALKVVTNTVWYPKKYSVGIPYS